MQQNQNRLPDNQTIIIDGLEISFSGPAVVSLGISGQSSFQLLIDQLGYGEADIPLGRAEAHMIEVNLQRPLAQINAALTQAAKGRYKSLVISTD